MTNKEAKETLEAVGGLLALVKITSKKDIALIKLIDAYSEAVLIAEDAIDLMDERLSIEDKGQDNDK